MPQTLLAFAGILLITTHAFTVQQWSIFSQRTSIARELEEMGGAVALESMEIIRTRAFDQSVINGLVTHTLADLGLMEFDTPSNNFRTGARCSVFGTGFEDCNDIDDFHAMETARMPFIMASDTVIFAVNVEVFYVTDELVRANQRTFNKKVVVSVIDSWDGIQDPFLARPIQLERVMSYEF
jgi:hypothetical protein